MTKYILAGGNDRGVKSYASLLKKELPNTLESLKLLSCFFSASQEEWLHKSHDWENWFSENLGIKNYSWANFDNFEERLKSADIIYFHGGNSELLIKSIKRYTDLEEHLKDKTVIGSSAGSNMLASNYWSPTYSKPGKGIGIIDINN